MGGKIELIKQLVNKLKLVRRDNEPRFHIQLFMMISSTSTRIQNEIKRKILNFLYLGIQLVYNLGATMHDNNIYLLQGIML